MNTLVSIIVPVYNRASLIEETLDSIETQTYSPIEVHIVDDGSTDTTRTVITEWMKKARHVNPRLHPLPHNVGKSAAVNYALGRFEGEYVMVFDSDDILLPDAITEEVTYLQAHPEVGIVSARSYIMKGGEKTSETFDTFKGQDSFNDIVSTYGDLLIKGNALISSTVLMRRKVVQQVGLLNVGLRYTHDWEYWIRAAQQFKIGFLARPIMYYRTNSAGSSSLNRFGTFEETCRLLLESQSSYDKVVLLKAMLYQTKYNAWLAYHDPNYGDMMKIFLFGCFSIAKLLVGRRAG